MENIKIKICTGQEAALREHIKISDVRRVETEKTMRNEGCVIECFFISECYFYVFKSIESFEKSRRVNSAATDPIMDVIKKMKSEYLESPEVLKSILDLNG